jgi:uncharacterized membrane protein YhaH (DUF805 family)
MGNKVLDLLKWKGKLTRSEFLGMFFLNILILIVLTKISTYLLGHATFVALFGIYLYLNIFMKRLRSINASWVWLLSIPAFIAQAVLLGAYNDLILIPRALIALPLFILIGMCFLKKPKEDSLVV